jgi:hypothetical protein
MILLAISPPAFMALAVWEKKLVVWWYILGIIYITYTNLVTQLFISNFSLENIIHRERMGVAEKGLSRHLPSHVKEAFAEVCRRV